MHVPLMMLLKKDYMAGVVTRKEFKARLREITNILEEARVCMNFEPRSSPEYVISLNTNEALEKINEWEKIIGKF